MPTASSQQIRVDYESEGFPVGGPVTKGRVSAPPPVAKNKAKQQAQRVVSINGTSPSFHIGGITYFRNDVLQFFWRDPQPYSTQGQHKIELTIEDSVWRDYYLPVFELIIAHPEYAHAKIRDGSLIPVERLDIKVGIYPGIFKFLVKNRWADARKESHEYAEKFQQDGYQADGIRVIAGESWQKPLAEFNESTKT
ncbi:MAG: hypothetical protein ACLP9S_04175 [Syntrophales bacterium]